MSNVLIVAPHPDDEVIGCGGVIQHHVKKNDDVFIHIVGNRVINHTEDRKYISQVCDQAHEAARFLGVKELFFSNLRDEQLDVKLIDVIVSIEDIMSKIRPEVVYIPNDKDTDQDHRAVANACKVATRRVKKVLAYEVLGPTKDFCPNSYVNIEGFLERKIQALHFYKEEVIAFPHPRSQEALQALARIRGVASGLVAAEAFELIKDVIE